MISLIPIAKIISFASVLYAAIIAIIFGIFSNPTTTLSHNILIATSGAGSIELFLLGIIYFGWRHIWKIIPQFNHLLFPDLNGEWNVVINWIWKDKPGTKNGTAYIRQDFIKISIELITDESESETLMVNPKKDAESGRPILYYIYRNNPTQKYSNSVSPHVGAAILKLNHKNTNLLEGNYFTDRGTQCRFTLTR